MKKSGIYQVTIPEPCFQSWDRMLPVEGGRFCDTCRKKVTDLSGMNAEQVLEFLMNNPGCCAKIPVRHLNRPIEYRVPVAAKKYRGSAIAAMLIAGVLQLPVHLSAQTDQPQHAHTDSIHAVVPSRPSFSMMADNKETSKKVLFTISGIVLDKLNEPMPFASVQIEQEGKTILGRMADIDGNFKIEVSSIDPGKKIWLTASSVGCSGTRTEIPSLTEGFLQMNIYIDCEVDFTMLGGPMYSKLSIRKGFTDDGLSFDRNDLMTFPR